jgi:hypothetical protein
LDTTRNGVYPGCPLVTYLLCFSCDHHGLCRAVAAGTTFISKRVGHLKGLGMKTLRFNFCHPVKVNVHMVPLTGTGTMCSHLSVDSDESNFVEIPIDQCSDGNWRIELEWEYGNESFRHKKEFKVKQNKLLH